MELNLVSAAAFLGAVGVALTLVLFGVALLRINLLRVRVNELERTVKRLLEPGGR